jgi:hypothetical protein
LTFPLSAVDLLSEDVCLFAGHEGDAGHAVVGLEGVEEPFRDFVNHLVVKLLLENDSTGVNVEDLKEVKCHLRRKSLC